MAGWEFQIKVSLCQPQSTLPKSKEKLLRDYRHRFRGALIVTDGVFSAEGAIAEVDSLVALARAYKCRLL